METITIRKCRKEDLGEVINLMRELSEVAHGWEGPQTSGELEDLHAHMERYPEIYWNIFAEVEGQTAGFLSVIFYKTFFHEGGTALINELIVGKAFRGRGIGTALIEATKAEALKRGMDEIEVGTEQTNIAAQKFYKGNGFDEEYVLLGMEFDE